MTIAFHSFNLSDFFSVDSSRFERGKKRCKSMISRFPAWETGKVGSIPFSEPRRQTNLFSPAPNTGSGPSFRPETEVVINSPQIFGDFPLAQGARN